MAAKARHALAGIASRAGDAPPLDRAACEEQRGACTDAQRPSAPAARPTLAQGRARESWEVIGYDFARYGVSPAAAQWRNVGFMEGYKRGRSELGVIPGTAAPFARVWMWQRAHAAAADLPFSQHLTAEYIRDIYPPACPITREALPAPHRGTRLCLLVRERGYAPGNVIVMGDRAHHAFSTVRHGSEMMTFYRKLQERGAQATHMQLNAREWLRMATLASFAHAQISEQEVAASPLAIMPPPGAAILSSAWAFKVACTDLVLLDQHESAHHLCDEHTLPAFNSFARTLRAAAEEAYALQPPDVPASVARRFAAEDAWEDPMVNQRWQEFATVLGRSTQPPAPVPHVPGALIAHRVPKGAVGATA